MRARAPQSGDTGPRAASGLPSSSPFTALRRDLSRVLLCPGLTGGSLPPRQPHCPGVFSLGATATASAHSSTVYWGIDMGGKESSAHVRS